ncbi:MAG: helix-turn-helix domain-containing protein [Proteobacteria bacterium]|nr:helix-turn-helix domain-containing protein [Pseudomonadota bacterium]
MMKANTLLVERLQLQMQRKNINARELAERAGLGRSFVYDVLSGKSSNPTTQKLAALADVLDCSILYLMGDSDTPNKSESTPKAAESVVNIASLMVENTSDGGTLVTEGEEEEAYYFRLAWIKNKLRAEPTDLRIVFVSDNRMEPMFSKGDMVLINLKDRAPEPSGTFIVFDGERLSARELHYSGTADGKKIIASTKDSPASNATMVIKDAQIVGRVVWLSREL